jgi:mono/diheme cytochrome c family protein
MKRELYIVLGLVLFVSAACGSGGEVGVDNGTPVPVPAEFAGQTNPLGADAATAGGEIFKNNCVPCHGEQGHGDGPVGAALDPRPKNLAAFAPTVGDDYLYWRINTGRDGTSMVAWKGVLTDEQIWQVVSFIRTLK